MFNVLAAAEASQYVRFLLQKFFGNQDRNRLSDRLFGGIAEQPFGAAVPTRDDAVEIFAFDCGSLLQNKGYPLPLTTGRKML